MPLSERSVLLCFSGKKGKDRKAQEFNQSIQDGKGVKHMAGSSPLTAAIASQVICLRLILQGKRKESGKYKLGALAKDWPHQLHIPLREEHAWQSLGKGALQGPPWPEHRSSLHWSLGTLSQPAQAAAHTQKHLHQQQSRARAREGTQTSCTDSGQQRQQFKYTEPTEKHERGIKLKAWKNRIKITAFHTKNNGHEVTIVQDTRGDWFVGSANDVLVKADFCGKNSCFFLINWNYQSNKQLWKSFKPSLTCL